MVDVVDGGIGEKKRFSKKRRVGLRKRQNVRKECSWSAGLLLSSLFVPMVVRSMSIGSLHIAVDVLLRPVFSAKHTFPTCEPRCGRGLRMQDEQGVVLVGLRLYAPRPLAKQPDIRQK